MIAVRANATTGFICGKAAKSGLRVNPTARRAGTTSSSALQIVGVSNSLRASRSAGFGRRGTAASSGHHRRSSALIGNLRARQGSCCYVPIINPSGMTSDKMTSTIAKQRSARLHLFQSEIQSRMTGPPVTSPLLQSFHVTDQHEKNSTELWLLGDKQNVISPKIFTRRGIGGSNV